MRTAATLAFALVVASSPSAVAKGRTLTGDWGVLIVQRASACEWNGVIRLVERDGQLSGRGSATASSAALRCPRLEGQVNGVVQGDVVRFGFGAGALGRAEFEGRIAPGGAEMTGTWTARSAAGEWAAAR